MAGPTIADKYSFGHNFQLGLIALTVQESDFMAKYRDVLNPNFLDNERLRFLLQMVISYHDKYKKPPNLDSMTHLLMEFKGNFTDKEFTELNTIIYNLYNSHVSERQFIIDKSVEFGQRQALKIAIQKSIHILKEGKGLTQIRGLVDQALVVGSSRDVGMDFSDAILDVPRYLKDDKIYDRIPLPWDRVNKSLLGGIGPGELFFVTGGPKYGKSTVLIEVTATAVLLGYPVVYITLELKELDILIRLACRMFNLLPTQILQKYPECLPIIKSNLIAKNLLRIKFFPTKSVGVPELRTYLNYLGSVTDFSPKIIVVDYGDRLKFTGDDPYQGMGRIYDDLIALGNDKEAAVATASQFGRGQYRSNDPDIDAVSDSWLKFANADLAMVMRQTKQERLCGLVRLYVAGARRGSDCYEVPCGIDYERYSVREMDQDKYQAIVGAAS